MDKYLSRQFQISGVDLQETDMKSKPHNAGIPIPLQCQELCQLSNPSSMASDSHLHFQTDES